MIACDCQKHSVNDLLFQVIASGVGTYLCFKLLDGLGCLENFKISLPGPTACIESIENSLEDDQSDITVEDIIDHLAEIYKLDKEKIEQYTSILLKWYKEGKLMECTNSESYTDYCKEIYEQLITVELGYDKI